MGGPGSGGYKTAPGDVETHSAWDIIVQDPGTTQKLAQVRCKFCAREMAQHTSRQRLHLLQCQPYLESMRGQGIENSITKQSSDPQGFFKNSKSFSSPNDAKPPKVLKMAEYPIAVRIQALALAEASISFEKIYEITGLDPKILAGLRKLARERGFDPSTSQQLREDYVVDQPTTSRPRGRPKKRKPEDELDPQLEDTPVRDPRALTGYVQADSLPPGNWNFMTPPGQGYAMA